MQIGDTVASDVTDQQAFVPSGRILTHTTLLV